MKKLILLSARFGLILCLFVFYSCEQATDSLVVPLIDTELVTEVRNLVGQEQKTAYGLLDEQEKSYLWKAQLDEIIKSNVITDNQKEHLALLQKRISSEFFGDNLYKRKFEDDFLNEWIYKANELFGNELLKTLVLEIHAPNKTVVNFTVIKTKKKVKDEVKTLTAGDDFTYCECSTQSDWCAPWNTCVSSACLTGYSQGARCGFFLNYECNGMC